METHGVRDSVLPGELPPGLGLVRVWLKVLWVVRAHLEIGLEIPIDLHSRPRIGLGLGLGLWLELG